MVQKQAWSQVLPGEMWIARTKAQGENMCIDFLLAHLSEG